MGAVAAAASFAGCNEGGMNENTPAKTGTSTEKNVAAEEDDFFDLEEDDVTDDDEDALVIQNSRLVRTADGAGVFGDVKNTGNETFTFLEVTATLYDETDDVLGEFFDNSEDESIDELGPGEVWDFEIFFEDADLGAAASYSLSASGTVAEDGGDGMNGTESPTPTPTPTSMNGSST